MNPSQTLPKPTIAMVIAFCDSTPHDPIPRPYVVAQAAAETGQHELWNMRVTPDMSSLDVFKAFTDAYLHEPSPASRMHFLPLAFVRTEVQELRIFAASHLFCWHNFLRLDDKELIAFTTARKQPRWTATTRLAVDKAYRSQGMKLILQHTRMVRQSQLGSHQAHA